MIGLVLAGGQSQRFGTDKGLYRFADMPVTNAQLAVQKLTDFCDQVFVSANGNNYQALNKLFQNMNMVQVIKDIPPFDHHGPLSGIYALASRYSHSIDVLMLAVDYPLVTSTDLAKLTDRQAYLTSPRNQHITIAHFKTSQDELTTELSHNHWRLHHFITKRCQPVLATHPHTLINFNYYQEKTHNEK